ncbi:MAG TPA: DUF6624 domain-containing protein, partial [Pyrinomonadaceae bacterium]|nr:DUF6624 domain-containing protein [Pyrinomonadaceae bacterium]
IFLYLDPTISREKFENTLAHELHHIGYDSSCPSPATAREIAALPPNPQGVVKLLGLFGEGFAMRAAAGGPKIHPHAVSNAEDRARWDRDVANFNNDLKRVEEFFLAILENRLSKEEIQKTASSFLGVQGPWYTVGWQMSVVIEQAYGRAKLIECICDQRKLLPTYNQAAAKLRRRSRQPLVVWSDSLLNKINQSSVGNPTLRKELLRRLEIDQEIRDEWIKQEVDREDKSLNARWKAIDNANSARMKEIVRQFGWPGPELIGQDGTDAAFILVQQADHEFQKQKLPLVKSAYQAGKLQGQFYALLLDRVLVSEGKPQVYGTQAKAFDKRKGKEPVPEPIENEAGVDHTPRGPWAATFGGISSLHL